MIGLMTALELRESGADVTVVDRGPVGQESSWAGGGILSPIYPWRYSDAISDLANWSQRQYPGLIAKLTASTGIDAELIRSGILNFDSDEITRALPWGHKYKCEINVIDQTEIRNLAPALYSDSFDSGLWIPGIFQVRNPRLVKALGKHLQELGVRIIEGESLTNIRIVNDAVTEVEVGNREFDCRTVVVACGAWTGEVLESILHDRIVKPIRGQMILFDSQPGVLSSVAVAGGNYLIPRADGLTLAGSTVEDVGFNKDTTTEAFAELKSFATGLLPALKKSDIKKHWSGLRPQSITECPIISGVPEIQGLFINSGHFRNGLTLAPGSARLIRNLIEGSDAFMDLALFSLDRTAKV